MHISRIVFRNYKALADFNLQLGETNILVGPNNCGKSTIIGAFRLLSEGLRRASNKKPEWVKGPDGRVLGYAIPTEALPVSLENVHTDYAEEASSIDFEFSTKSVLTLHFPKNGGCALIPTSINGAIATTAAFRKSFPFTIGVIPVLGPLEHNEPVVTEETVRTNLYTHRACRHFRNYWRLYPDRFTEFSELISATWPGMDIMPPERTDVMSDSLQMFCKEDRLDRELYWSGFGFQIWCQLLTHIVRSADRSLIVIDEPEIYLHPEVQRQLLGILRGITPRILMATHSTEIMGEADPAEIILVDKSRRAGRRLRDIDQVQAALELVGSVQNITLTQLARTERVLFVEGPSDYQLLRKFARQMRMMDLANGIGLSCVESGGFSAWERVRDAAWGISETLSRRLKTAIVLDRDYRPEEEMESITQELGAHLKLVRALHRKEIENYLLAPEAIQRCIDALVRDRGLTPTSVEPQQFDVAIELDQIMGEFRSIAQAQILAKRSKYFQQQKLDPATINARTLEWFDEQWADRSGRIAIVPGKQVVARLRQRIQDELKVTVTDARIISQMRRQDFAPDLVEILTALDGFRLQSTRLASKSD